MNDKATIQMLRKAIAGLLAHVDPEGDYTKLQAMGYQRKDIEALRSRAVRAAHAAMKASSPWEAGALHVSHERPDGPYWLVNIYIKGRLYRWYLSASSLEIAQVRAISEHNQYYGEDPEQLARLDDIVSTKPMPAPPMHTIGVSRKQKGGHA